MKDPKQRKLFHTDSMTSTAMMRRVKRPAMEAPYKKPVEFKPPERKEPDPELHMPDEDRVFCVSMLKRCPRCGAAAYMRRFTDDGVMKFQVYCGQPMRLEVGCGNETQICDSSKEAVNLWQMAAILSK